MKYIYAAAALAALVAAQEQCLSVAVAIPQCGLGCITPVAGDLGCDLTDFACQCMTENVAAIQSSAQSCVISACGGVESALMVQSAANSVCECASSAGGGGGSMMPSSSDAMPTGDMSSSMDMGSMTTGGGMMPTETGGMSDGDMGDGDMGDDDMDDGDMSSSAAGGSDISTGAANGFAVAGSVGGVMGGLLALIAAL